MHAVAPPPAGVIFRAIDEVTPGSKLRSLYERRADAYRQWYLRDGDEARPSLDQGLAALQEHMPQMVPVPCWCATTTTRPS